MSFRRLFAVARKEYRHITRDARLLFLVTLAPVLLLVTFSYVFGLDVRRVDVAVRDLDRSSLSRALISSLTADDDFVLVAYIDRDAQITALFRRGVADLVLVIPRGLSDALLGGEPAEIQCIVDGTDAITARQGVRLVEDRIGEYVTGLQGGGGRAAQPAINVSERAWYNETLESLNSMVPGMLAVIMCMPALALTLALAREKETGSFEGLIATPVQGAEYLVGKLIAYEGGGLVSGLLAWSVALLWFRVPFRGSLVVLLLLVADYLFASMSFSVVVANFVRNQQTAMFLVLMVFFVPSFFIAGLIVPVADEPVARAIANALPATHFITICRGVFLKGLGVSDLWLPALVLLATGVVCHAIGLMLFRKRLC